MKKVLLTTLAVLFVTGLTAEATAQQTPPRPSRPAACPGAPVKTYKPSAPIHGGSVAKNLFGRR